jgi:prophage tail gpP-like protein
MTGLAELKIDGVRYGGWQRVHVARSIEQLAGSFELEITERWPGQPVATPIRPGQRCRLELDGAPVIGGYVDSVSPDYDAAHHRLRVVGRDATGDLCDCSAIHQTGQWHDAGIGQIARDLLAPYAIALVVEAGDDLGEPFASYNIEEGETVFECLARAARLRARLLTSNPDGELVITRAGKERLAVGLLEGGNIEAARAEFSYQERFSDYTLKGQLRLGDFGDTELAASTGTARDENILRHRPLIVIADAQSDNATLAERAEWECHLRRGRSLRGSLTVTGWTRPDGGLWRPNALLPVTSPRLWLDAAEMLIVACTYTLDAQAGTQTELTIARPEAFELLEGVRQSKLSGTLKTRAQRTKREQVTDWSLL